VDISGFTVLNAWLVKEKGRLGPEIMSECLNDYFTRIINLVHEGGGDVVKFAGDALLCLWSDGDVIEQAVNAVQAACTITNELDCFEVAHGIQLSLHAGLSSGSVNAVHVGGVQSRCEFFLAGGDLFGHLGWLLDATREVCFLLPEFFLLFFLLLPGLFLLFIFYCLDYSYCFFPCYLAFSYCFFFLLPGLFLLFFFLLPGLFLLFSLLLPGLFLLFFLLLAGLFVLFPPPW
jgi:hypothetical protein